FNFSPLVTLPYDSSTNSGLTETWYGENAVWQSAVLPGFPILFSSSLPEHQHFGPCFPTSIKFSCSGADSLAQVEVS
ncbi:hypothetical protein ACE4ZU_27030, partial [Salmonella enterica]|uniref:hypothetical protein n=1 Tax=Salmonella enterica TaxID=28901 RepID=UPI003D2C91C3